MVKTCGACIGVCAHEDSYVVQVFTNTMHSLFAVLSLQTCQGDVEDEETLKAVEVAVRESTSAKRIAVDCPLLKWTNVATAILKGAAENQSLRELTLQTPKKSSPPQHVVDEVKQKRRRVMLRLNVEERLVDVVHVHCLPSSYVYIRLY